MAPEALGGGYPVQAGIIKDESGNIISGEQNPKPVLDQVRGQINFAAEKAKSLLGPTSAGFPVEAGIIKDENGNIISAKQETKIKLDQEAKTSEKAEEVKPSTESHRVQAMSELKMAVEKAKPHLEQAMVHIKEASKETMHQVMEAAAGHIGQLKAKASEGNEMEDTTSVEKSKSQVKEAAEADKDKVKETPEKDKVKETTEQMKEGAGSVVNKIQEKLEERKAAHLAEKPLLEQAKIKYRETMPEILGGRPASISEVIKFGMNYEAIADKQKEEAKKFEELPPEEQSFLGKLKHDYREKAPVVLGGRPTPIQDKVEEVVKNKVDSIKNDAQEEVDNLKESYEQGNLGEHLKERVKDHLPESLGGRPPTPPPPPTLGEKVKNKVEQVTTDIGKKILKNRVNATIEGTKEQIQNMG